MRETQAPKHHKRKSGAQAPHTDIIWRRIAAREISQKSKLFLSTGPLTFKSAISHLVPGDSNFHFFLNSAQLAICTCFDQGTQWTNDHSFTTLHPHLMAPGCYPTLAKLKPYPDCDCGNTVCKCKKNAGQAKYYAPAYYAPPLAALSPKSASSSDSSPWSAKFGAFLDRDLSICKL